MPGHTSRGNGVTTDEEWLRASPDVGPCGVGAEAFAVNWHATLENGGILRRQGSGGPAAEFTRMAVAMEWTELRWTCAEGSRAG